MGADKCSRDAPPFRLGAHQRCIWISARRSAHAYTTAPFSKTQPAHSAVGLFHGGDLSSSPPSAIVNECRMRPHSSRPLQYEDGVGGSQRRAASSGTNTGDGRAGKCGHGKTRGLAKSSRTHGCFSPGVADIGRDAVRIYPARAREATAVISGSPSTMSGGKQGSCSVRGAK
ncbi:unnamed protein product [Pleuronectes platessa]|uniref:Uncharacterized protein n=1 Tax=Pleuronectes platessa TaxID=8262 RepID=A0A9N7YRS6_PLEPL|nr:unnamed protein product [Pleuronectes platessa]